MGETPKFGCPLIIQELERNYGEQCHKENISLRESEDVTKFLELKDKREKEAIKSKLRFK